jgi:error-prone DNA polymerase
MAPARIFRMSGIPYAELSAFTNFSFLEGASHPEEMAGMAAALGLAALAVADVNTFAGIVRAHVSAKEAGLRFIPATRLRLGDEPAEIIAYPTTRAAYGRLCRLLTRGKRRAPKGSCDLGMTDVLEFGEGQCFALAPPEGRLLGAAGDSVARALARLGGAFPGRVWLAAARAFGPADAAILEERAMIARKAKAPLLAVTHALYHTPARRRLADVLACIREKTTIDRAGFLLAANAERHLKAPTEMARLFAAHPAAIEETLRLAGECRFSLDELRYEYPKETAGLSGTPQEELERLAFIGLKSRYPDGAPERVRAQVVHELSIIGALSYAPYFLTVYDIVRFARERGILCQGRGSAANSAVCYALGVTSVDPARMDVLFERFISAERREPPDIDVDFEHERREEVIQYIYRKYGRERAGIAATVITYRSRSALREVGKAMGLSEDAVAALSGMARSWRDGRIGDAVAEDTGLDPHEPTIALTLELAREIKGFPRHLSQHTGGFVMTDGPLEELIPIGNAAMDERTFVEWDKDDLDSLGIIKVDVLGLGMLTAIAKSFALLKRHYGLDLDIATVPPEERAVYDMICRADTLGVFQIESRAQMQMLPRLRPRNFYDLVIEVAIVRPGPIQGDMVHPYLRRRRGEEKVEFPSKELEAVLGKTLGVPLFQEQAMRIAIVAAGFTPSEADRLRRAMATFRKSGTIRLFGEKMIEGMKARGYDASFAERCFRQIEGFGEYGFPESHAASFALLVYVSCWLKCRYPDVFCAAMLNSQPLGFYAPAQLVRDAREHGVEMRVVDVNCSEWDATLEPPFGRAPIAAAHWPMAGEMRHAFAVRLGFRQIKGLSEEAAGTIVRIRTGDGAAFDSVRDFWLRTGLSRAVIERLAEADAFSSLGLSRRDALWAAKALPAGAAEDEPELLLAAEAHAREQERALPRMAIGEEVIHDYKTLRLSLRLHPLALLRADVAARRFIPCAALRETPSGARAAVAGLVLVRQRPGTASGVIFATLEDETGVANIIIWPKIFEAHRRAVIGARLMGVAGAVQRDGDVIHLIAATIEDLTPLLARLSERYGPETEAYARADEFRHGGERADPRGARDEKRREQSARVRNLLPKSRDFH